MREYHGTNEFVTGNDGTKRRVFCAYVSPSEIRLHLASGWRAYAAEAVKPETWTAASAPITAKGAIESTHVDWLIDWHVKEVRAVFIPSEMNDRKEELFAAATGPREKTADTRLHRASPQYARERVVFLIRCCTALVQNFQKISLGMDHEIRDPIVIQQLTEAREAVPEIYAVMLEVAKNLLNGDGNRLAELLDIKVDDQSAHVMLQYGVQAMLVLHFLGLGTADRLVHAFFAAIFMNIGRLAGDEATEENHAAHSARIYRAVCSKKPELPGTVADLILDHGTIWLSNTVMRFVLDDGTGSITSKRRMYAQVAMSAAQPATFTGSDGSVGTMQLLDSRHIAFALTLTVVEQIVDRSMQNERAADVLTDMAARLASGGYDLTGDGAEHQCVFASVLAAAANAYKAKPRGAVIVFGQQGKIPGGRPISVSLGHPETPSAPHCLVLVREGSPLMLPQAQTLHELIGHEPRTLRRNNQLLLGMGTELKTSLWITGGSTVVGFVDPETYSAHCAETEARLERIIPLLEHGGRSSAKNS